MKIIKENGWKYFIEVFISVLYVMAILQKNSNHKLGKTGCPISALFEYCSEPQICAIKWNTYFKGINISFSDRTDFLTCRWYNNISLWLKVFFVVEIFNIFELYRRALGAKINVRKSEIVCMFRKIIRG